MSTSSIQAANAASIQTLFFNRRSAANGTVRTDSNSQSPGGSSVQGSSLFDALYHALTSFVANNEASSSSGTSSSSSSSGSSLSTDLQNFLADLFSALRQAGGHGHHQRGGGAPPPPTSDSTANTATTPAATTATSATTAASTTPTSGSSGASRQPHQHPGLRRPKNQARLGGFPAPREGVYSHAARGALHEE